MHSEAAIKSRRVACSRIYLINLAVCRDTFFANNFAGGANALNESPIEDLFTIITVWQWLWHSWQWSRVRVKSSAAISTKHRSLDGTKIMKNRPAQKLEFVSGDFVRGFFRLVALNTKSRLRKLNISALSIRHLKG